MPDSQKSTFDKASENVTSTGDKLAGSLQPGVSPVLNAFHVFVNLFPIYSRIAMM